MEEAGIIEDCTMLVNQVPVWKLSFIFVKVSLTSQSKKNLANFKKSRIRMPRNFEVLSHGGELRLFTSYYCFRCVKL
jgi:hypothetical protein